MQPLQIKKKTGDYTVDREKVLFSIYSVKTSNFVCVSF